jgi:hypothetical protein
VADFGDGTAWHFSVKLEDFPISFQRDIKIEEATLSPGDGAF